ncbi:MAG: hypothetical protein KGM24_14945, partial [Elusimicrobia bacterium]|nr:hypothetical protein [Elusimicrobiota bacterium]
AAALVRAHPLFAAAVLPPALTSLRALAAGTLDPARAKAALASPRVRALFADPAFKRALLAGDPSALLADPRVKALLADPELAEKLKALAPR